MALVSVDLSLAHSWFPIECCGKKDYIEITKQETIGDNIKYYTKDSSKLVHKLFIIRPSQDGKAYICYTPYQVYCIFMPAGT